MPKKDPPLTVEIPRPESDHPAWSRVGIVGLAGFVIGIAWPRVAGWKIGPSVPSDLRAQVEASASPTSAPAPKPPPAPGLAASTVPAVAATPVAAPDGAVSANQQLVVVGPGKIIKCVDKKDKKVDDCEKLLFDPIAVKKLRELSKCTSALGLSGKLTLGFEVNFEKKEVHVVKTKKPTTLPSTTVNGIVQCAAREFSSVDLTEVPHKYRRYTLSYGLTFYPPGKHPEDAAAAQGDEDPAAGATTSETDATGSATVSADSTPLRKEPKGTEKVGRLVRGTKVKIIGRQNDWYKVESGSKVGWVYRGSIGL